MELIKYLNSRGVNRRDFLKLMGATAAVLGLSELQAPSVAEAVEAGVKKPPVIWLHGQECTGCTTSMLSTFDPGPAEVVLDLLSIRYHETIMAGSGHVAEQALHETIKEGGYVLVVEGSIPTVDGRFMTIGGKPFDEILKESAANAAAIIALGACAAYGGIPAAGPTGAKGVQDFIKDKPVINIPGCPAKPTWLFGTVMHYLMFKKVPPLDEYGRPKAFFGNLLHDNCPRRGHFERGEFLRDWNDPAQSQYCLLVMGCKGPKTYSDCAQSFWNDGVNFCIGAGSPCAGCTQPEFYAAADIDDRPGFAPLYVKQDSFKLPGIGGVDAKKAGVIVTGATVAGLGLHFGGKVATGRNKDSHDAPEEADK